MTEADTPAPPTPPDPPVTPAYAYICCAITALLALLATISAVLMYAEDMPNARPAACAFAIGAGLTFGFTILRLRQDRDLAVYAKISTERHAQVMAAHAEAKVERAQIMGLLHLLDADTRDLIVTSAGMSSEVEAVKAQLDDFVKRYPPREELAEQFSHYLRNSLGG